jgi:hypothetical protein
VLSFSKSPFPDELPDAEMLREDRLAKVLCGFTADGAAVNSVGWAGQSGDPFEGDNLSWKLLQFQESRGHHGPTTAWRNPHKGDFAAKALEKVELAARIARCVRRFASHLQISNKAKREIKGLRILFQGEDGEASAESASYALHRFVSHALAACALVGGFSMVFAGPIVFACLARRGAVAQKVMAQELLDELFEHVTAMID